MKAPSPASTEPIGAPSPLDRQNIIALDLRRVVGHRDPGDRAGVEDAGAVQVQRDARGTRTPPRCRPARSTGMTDPPPTWCVFSMATRSTTATS